jgi:hypothetical protein
VAIILVSAAFGKQFKRAKIRFKKQFKRSVLIDELLIFDDEWVSSANLDINAKLFVSNFIWKPYVVSEVISSISNEDILIYLDIGCEFDDEMLARAIECIRTNGSTFMQLDHPLNAWISPTLFGKGPFQGIDSNTCCVAAGTLFLVNNESTSKFIAEWLKWTMNSNHIYAIGNGEKNHRHDQSILSAIIYKYNFNIIPDNCYVSTENLFNNLAINNNFAIVLRNKSSLSMLCLRKLLLSYFYFFPRKWIIRIYNLVFKISQRL